MDTETKNLQKHPRKRKKSSIISDAEAKGKQIYREVQNIPQGYLTKVQCKKQKLSVKQDEEPVAYVFCGLRNRYLPLYNRIIEHKRCEMYNYYGQIYDAKHVMPDKEYDRFNYIWYQWNITQMMCYIEQQEYKPISILMNDQFLKDSNCLVKVNKDYAMETDITKPGIIIELLPGEHLLVDGHHRLHKAQVMGVTEFFVYVLNFEEQIPFLADKCELNHLIDILINRMKKSSY